MSKNTAGEMWCYLWYYKNDLTKCKFGERFVKPGQDPLREVRKRVRDQQQTSKHLFDDGEVVIEHAWNVSKLARKVSRNYAGGHMDDYLRSEIGFRLNTTGEWHTLSPKEMAIKVNRHLARLGAPLPVANLSQPQATELLSVKAQFDSGHSVVLAELCARFGKTIWSGALSKEMDVPLTIVATYVQTVTTSFIKDLTSFKQWADYVHVDTKDEDYQGKISTALREGKKVIAYLSLCQGDLRDERIRFLSSKRVQKLLVIDEADFGAHRKNQVDALAPFREGRNAKSTKVLLMTGTNGDRASALWSPTAAVSVVYPELLVAKQTTREAGATIRKQKDLTHFRVDTGRHLLYPSVELYQANLSSVVDFALHTDPALFDDGKDNLPSWSKFAANPIKAKGFFVTMLRAAFNGELSLDDINVDHQLGTTGPRVRMMFLPGSTRNDNMDKIVNIARDTLPGWTVVPLYGKETSNRKAEQLTKEKVETALKEDKSVLILSAGMAQRSFSVGEIEEVYLAYDSGDIGATIQKMSRALTPNGSEDKIGRIISLSFDPNRDDKFDSVMLEAAKNLTKKTGTDINTALKEVFRSIDLFRFSEDGAVEIGQDRYLREVLDVRRISRVIGASADLTGLSQEMLKQIAAGNAEYFRQARIEAAKKGKTYQQKRQGKKGAKDKDPSKVDIAKAREVIVALVENVDILIFGTGSKTIQEALATIQDDPSLHPIVEQEFGVPFELVAYLFESGVINQNLVNLRIAKECY